MSEPRISWPNRISFSRILLIGPFVIALLHLQDHEYGNLARWSALGVFTLMALSDGLDGFLARRLHQETALGRFLDPLADKLLILCSVLLLANEETAMPGRELPSAVAVIAVGKDIVVVTGFCAIYFITSQWVIQPNRVGKLTTFAQLSTIIAILISPNLPKILYYLPDVLWWTATALAVAAMIQYFRVGHAFVAAYEKNRPAASNSPNKPA